jgi:hypothetical protein
MAGGRNLKFIFRFMETPRKPLHLDKRSLVQWKITNMPVYFIWIIILFNGPFEYGDGTIFKPLRWIQNLHQSTGTMKLCILTDV